MPAAFTSTSGDQSGCELGDGPAAALSVAHVARESEAAIADRFGNRLTLFAAARDHANRGALRAKRDRSPDPAPAAGDDRGPITETTAVRHVVSHRRLTQVGGQGASSRPASQLA
jgi:hypothetical protein